MRVLTIQHIASAPCDTGMRISAPSKVLLETKARGLLALQCCKAHKNCVLKRVLYDDGVNVVITCLKELYGMKRREKRDYLRDKIRNCCIEGLTEGKGKTGKAYHRYSWNVGLGSKGYVVEGVCRYMFCRCYEIGHTLLEVLCNEIKTGITTSMLPLGDRTNFNIRRHPEYGQIINEIVNRAQAEGVRLSREQIAMMQIPNTVDSLTMYGWMEFYFNLVGDEQPNENEIHLDPVPITTIYKEYQCDMIETEFVGGVGVSALTKESFLKMWESCFPYVKIRTYKSVDGKCKTCARLSYLRRRYRNRDYRHQITRLFYIHRSAYMGERATYAQRSQLALQSPQDYLSIATDGMQQAHCMLPYLGNQNNLGAALPQHFQGVLVHGRFFNMFRSFHTVKCGSDFQIHTLLLTLEEILRDKGKLPDTLTLQLDGGVENTAKVMLAVCELLVVMRLVQVIQISRLMVGHTHIDVDGYFGRLWKFIRTMHLHTIGAYFTAVVIALSTAVMKCFVKDIYVVPNYTKLLQPSIDTAFGHYAKGEATQHVFEFSACDRDEWFPNGCKVRYRKYSQDEICILKQVKGKDEEGKENWVDFEALDEDADSDEEDINIKLVSVKSKWQPEAVYEDGILKSPEGMYILQELPNAEKIEPIGLLKGSRQTFVSVLEKITSYFSDNPSVIREWKRWDQELVPQSDDVQEYLQKCPDSFKIPLREELFGGVLPDLTTHIKPDTRKPKRQLGDCLTMEKVDATASVSWGKREGLTRPIKQPAYVPRKNESDEVPEASIISLSKHVPKSKVSKQKKKLQPLNKQAKKRMQKSDDASDSDESDYMSEKEEATATKQGDMMYQNPNNKLVKKRNEIQASNNKIATYAYKNTRMTELTMDEKERFEQICNSDVDMDGILLTDRFGIEITYKDFKRLKNSHYFLNDQIIDHANKLIQQRETGVDGTTKYLFLSAFFYDKLMSRVQNIPSVRPIQAIVDQDPEGDIMDISCRATQLKPGTYNYEEAKSFTRKFNIFAFEKVFVPVNIENIHWILIVISIPDKRISYYDSINKTYISDGKRAMKMILQYLKDEAMQIKSSTEVIDTEWKLETAECPKQCNSNDCGVFVIQYVDYLTSNIPMTFTQNNMDFFRRRIGTDILAGKLITEPIVDLTVDDEPTDSIEASKPPTGEDTAPKQTLSSDITTNNNDIDKETLEENQLLHLNKGMYEELHTDDEIKANEDSEWVRKRKNFIIPGFGNAALLVGREFNFKEEYAKKNSSINSQNIFKFSDVVMNRNNTGKAKDTMYCKHFNMSKYRNESLVPPNEWHYILASDALNNSKTKKCIILHNKQGTIDNYYGAALIGRVVRTDFRKDGIFKGTISKYDKTSKKYTVMYCDATSQTHDLSLILQNLRID